MVTIKTLMTAEMLDYSPLGPAILSQPSSQAGVTILITQLRKLRLKV